MIRCKVINFFSFIIPLKHWRDFLIRHHFQKCPSCQVKLASVEEVKSFLIQEDEVEYLEGLWLAVKAKLGEGEREEHRFQRPWRRWAFGTASLLVAMAAGIWLYHVFTLNKSPSKENLVQRFQINHIRIEEKPAQAFLFQPQGSEMIVVWAEKSL